MRIFSNGIFSIFLTLLAMVSCVDPYDPNITQYENILVVDGEINNLPGPYEVRLTETYKFSEDSGAAVSGAQVKILDNNGLEVPLTEVSKGIYRTDSSFQGVIGNHYKLQIVYGNDSYESDFEELKAPVPIDSVYWEYLHKNNGTDGIQLLLNTHDPSNSTHYYSWDYDETWKIMAPYETKSHPEWKVCFDYAKSYGFHIGTSIQQTSDRIAGYPLEFIGSGTNKLFWRYSVLVKQSSLPDRAYEFYKKLNTLNENQGTLFDPVPYSVVGNVKCLNDANRPILGYFLVAGVSQKRIFIDRNDLPFEYEPVNGFGSCSLASLQLGPLTEQIPSVDDSPSVDSLKILGYILFDIDTSRYVSSGVTQYTLLLSFTKSAKCFNCTLSGKNKVPDYWVEP